MTEHPASPLTGLLNPTHFGRPDLTKIMDEHYESMLKLFKDAGEKGDRKKRKVESFSVERHRSDMNWLIDATY